MYNFVWIETYLQHHYNKKSFVDICKILVIGIPNVGKSTLINLIRMAVNPNLKVKECVKTGALPGVTKSLSSSIKISSNPDIFLVDSPGITSPKIVNVEQGLKIGLVGGLNDKQIGERLLLEYLLFTLNKNHHFEYLNFLKCNHKIDNIAQFIEMLANRIGAKKQGNSIDYARTCQFALKYFRLGKFGKFLLD